MLRNTIAQHRGVQILDLNKKLCPDGVYTAKVDGIKVRSDGVHLTPEGVQVADAVARGIVALAVNRRCGS